MSPTVNHVRSTRNAEQRGFCAHVAPVQSGTARHTSAEQDGVISSYDIEPDFTIGAVLVAVLGAGISIGLAIGIGICRTFGAR